jgi:16S rRNA (guanine(966)-N(2))-methyltransferase RsmD
VGVRVTGGALKGRKLHPLRGMTIRPTSDFLKESIFNILAGSVDDAVVLDLFAGTGSLGIEALSRGAATAVFVDNAPQAIKTLIRNVKTCSLEKQSTILKRNVLRGLSFLGSIGYLFDLIFIDPPYDKGCVEKTLQLLDRSGSTSDLSSVVVEHSKREILPDKIDCFTLRDQRDYGKTLVSFYTTVL